jgi:ferredoxin-NADP reductase
LFRETLRAAILDPEVELHLVSEGETDAEFPTQPGRLSIPLVTQALGGRFSSSNYYLSGPPAMIRSFRSDLATAGIPQDRIHIDEWE